MGERRSRLTRLHIGMGQVQIPIYVPVCVYIYACTYVCLYVYTYVCVYNIYIYIYTYIYTYIYIYIIYVYRHIGTLSGWAAWGLDRSERLRFEVSGFWWEKNGVGVEALGSHETGCEATTPQTLYV